MKERKREIDEKNITGFITRGAEIRGELFFEGTFRLDGYLKGTIDSESTLVVGEQGKIEGEIRVRNLVNHGEIKGIIQAKEKVEVSSFGRVIGTINSPKLVIQEGAYLEADCQTLEIISAPAAEKKSIPE